jgi:hypothetical protein
VQEYLEHGDTLVAKSPSGNLDLRIKFGKRADGMLLDFVNTIADPDGFARFKDKWERYGLRWQGGADGFRASQSIVRKTWDGTKRGIEGTQVAASLGLLGSDGEDEVSPPPIRVDWEESSLYVAPRNLHDLVWLALLQHSQRLGVCENHVEGGGCLTPYFLKYRPTARFCWDGCAVTAQRESKRRWWKEHGQEWLEKRRGKKAKRVRRQGR